MATSVCLLACALTLGQGADRGDWQLAPRLSPGLELVYAGSYVEESLIPNVRYQRQYRLGACVLVLEERDKAWNVAVLTTLTPRAARNDKQSPAGKTAPSAPASVRLELARVDAQGRVRSAAGKTLPLALFGPPTAELGFLVQAPTGRVGRNFTWEMPEEGRSPCAWTVLGTEAVNGITCVKVQREQTSDDWKFPRADRAAWHRRDILWLSPKLFVAQKVERIIERRDPARQQPTQRATVRYELESRLRYPGRLLEERRAEIAQVGRFTAEARPWLRLPVPHRAEIDGLLRRIARYAEHHEATPYRPALAQLKTRLEAAQRGESPPEENPEEAPAAPVRSAEVGRRVPDFVVSGLTGSESDRLYRHLGRPVLVIFCNPQTPTSKEALLFAKRLAEARQLDVLALAVTGDAETAKKQHRALALPFPLLDGRGLRRSFGVEATPRLVLLDGEAVVRAALTGWGYETPTTLTEALSRCRSK